MPVLTAKGSPTSLAIEFNNAVLVYKAHTQNPQTIQICQAALLPHDWLGLTTKASLYSFSPASPG